MMEKRNILIFLIILLITSCSGFLSADTYVVTSTADNGDGSLRWALTEANQHAGAADTIVFNIPDTDTGFDGAVWWIRPQTMLPVFYDDSTWVSGESQTINMGNKNTKGPEVLIYGGDITDPNQAIGFLIMSSGNKISGLVISGFKSFGIRFRNSTAQHNEICGNYIGTDPAGENAMPNLTGIYISRYAGSTIIGGGGEERRNIISGNIQNGIYTVLSDSNVITGNYIGTDPSGKFSIPNASDGKHSGIWISYGKHNIIGGSDADKRNIISGNGRDAIHMTYADSNTVIGNYMGVDVTGTVLLANGTTGKGDGFDIRYGSSYNIIGGSSPGEGNIVCGSPNMGIRIGETNYVSSSDHNIVL
ncbi:right-handed parallel beta-helix repeat-containing protein, partial [bacterium]|nr:right-handed parallel beta-helix repeat-containing protein [bacterium]